MTQNFRAEAISNALEAYKANGLTRTETIEYRGASRNFEVVTISPEVPLLNPDNSRLRAQLREHPQYSLVATNPASPEAQKVLAYLLSSTEKFGELKTQLVDYGQQEPGIISRDGTLVNGNTRLTAIRELGKQGFDVAVLPADATNDDFFQIEMALQLRKYVHQDYTFTNELLLVDDYLNRTQDEQGTINAMQWKKNGKKKLRLAQGYLALVEEIRAMNKNLRYDFFDKRSELVKNLYDDYAKLSEHSPLEAEKLKMTRVMGLFLGLNKDEIRETDETFLEESILVDINGDELEKVFAPFKSEKVEVDVLDVLLDESPQSSFDMKKMVIEIASKVVNEEGLVSDALVDQNFKKLHSKFRSSARQIREDRINKDALSEPIEYLKDVTTRIQGLADRIPILVKDPQFDATKFEFHAKKTDKAISALQDALKRVFGE
jgi:hypothetical protein